MQSKTRVFCFDDDDLDNSRQLYECFTSNGAISNLSMAGLPGTHLTPVYLKLGIEDVGSEIPEEAKQVATQIFGAESASFGNEDELNALVREICSWMTSGPSSREPKWKSENTIDDARFLSPKQ